MSKLALGGLFVKSENATLDAALAAIARAVELGVNYLDTAPAYGDSEEVVGRALAALPDGGASLVVSTKLGGRPTPFDPKDVGALRGSVEESLRLLGRESIDLLMVHEPDRPQQHDWWTSFARVEGPVLGLLDDLKREGLVKATGVGGTTTTEMAHLVRSGKFDAVLTAFNSSLLFREAETELLPAAEETGTGVIVGSPLQQGVFVKPWDTVFSEDAWWISRDRKAQFEALYELQRDLGMGMPELALRFVVSNPLVATVLMGAKSVAEVEENAAGVEKGPLPPDVLTRLDEVHAMLPRRPAGEPEGMGWYIANPAGYPGQGSL